MSRHLSLWPNIRLISMTAIMNRHDEIRQEILRRINGGIWPVGSDIPHEIVLTEEFGAARGTIRRALSTLVEQGLIERRKRAGSRVIGQTSQTSKLQIPLIREEIENRGFRYSYRLLEREIISVRHGIGARNGLLRIDCLHLANDTPFQLEHRTINLDRLPQAADQPFLTSGPNEWLVREVPATRVITRISAASANPEIAEILAVPENAPLLIVRRETFMGEDNLTEAQLSHPAERYEVTTISI